MKKVLLAVCILSAFVASAQARRGLRRPPTSVMPFELTEHEKSINPSSFLGFAFGKKVEGEKPRLGRPGFNTRSFEMEKPFRMFKKATLTMTEMNRCWKVGTSSSVQNLSKESLDAEADKVVGIIEKALNLRMAKSEEGESVTRYFSNDFVDIRLRCYYQYGTMSLNAEKSYLLKEDSETSEALKEAERLKTQKTVDIPADEGADIFASGLSVETNLVKVTRASELEEERERARAAAAREQQREALRQIKEELRRAREAKADERRAELERSAKETEARKQVEAQAREIALEREKAKVTAKGEQLQKTRAQIEEERKRNKELEMRHKTESRRRALKDAELTDQEKAFNPDSFLGFKFGDFKIGDELGDEWVRGNLKELPIKKPFRLFKTAWPWPTPLGRCYKVEAHSSVSDISKESLDAEADKVVAVMEDVFKVKMRTPHNRDNSSSRRGFKNAFVSISVTCDYHRGRLGLMCIKQYIYDADQEAAEEQKRKAQKTVDIPAGEGADALR